MHFLHGDDLYRHSPLVLRHLPRNVGLVAFEIPLCVSIVVGIAVIEACKRVHLGVL